MLLRMTCRFDVFKCGFGKGIRQVRFLGVGGVCEMGMSQTLARTERSIQPSVLQ